MKKYIISQFTRFVSDLITFRVGGFDESPPHLGVPEDLIFFFAHLRHGGRLKRVDHDVIVYRYHAGSLTNSVKSETIRHVRVAMVT